MSKRTDKEYLLDISEAIKRIELYVENLDYQNFLKDIKTQDAVLRNIEIIGEAVKKLSRNLKIERKNIQWKEIAGMRDKVIHFYFGVNWDIVWKTMKDKLPEIKEHIENLLNNLDK